jgi:hypothetical protein
LDSKSRAPRRTSRPRLTQASEHGETQHERRYSANI